MELGWEEAWAGMSSYALAGTWRNEQLGELLGKVAEAANMNEFERLEKTEGRGKNAGKWHSAEPNLICLLALDWAFPSLSLKHQQPMTSRGPDVGLPMYVSVTATL